MGDVKFVVLCREDRSREGRIQRDITWPLVEEGYSVSIYNQRHLLSTSIEKGKAGAVDLSPVTTPAGQLGGLSMCRDSQEAWRRDSQTGRGRA
jgi:hypothetical protein